MTTSKNTATSINNDSKLDAIKELIFGQNMVEYDQQFDKLNDKVNTNHDKLREDLKSMKDEMGLQLKEMNNEWKSELNKFRRSTEKILAKHESELLEKVKLGQMLVDMGNALIGEK